MAAQKQKNMLAEIFAFLKVLNSLDSSRPYGRLLGN